jgi:hypothetical protein
VQSGVFKVVSNWHIGVIADGNADDFDICSAAVAQMWATGKYLREVGEFVGKEVTAQAVKKALDVLFPASWAVEVLREQIVGWIYKAAVDYFSGQTEFRSDRHSLTVTQIREIKIPLVSGYKTGAVLSGNLPGNLTLTTYFLVGYDREARRVSVLVVSQHDGVQGLFGGDRVRAWEAKYEIDENGLPKNPKQSLQRVDLADIQIPSEAELPKNELEPEPNLVEPQPCKYFMPINTSLADAKNDVPISPTDLIKVEVRDVDGGIKAIIEVADLSDVMYSDESNRSINHRWIIDLDIDGPANGTCSFSSDYEVVGICPSVPEVAAIEMGCQVYRCKRTQMAGGWRNECLERVEDVPGSIYWDVKKNTVTIEAKNLGVNPKTTWRAIGFYHKWTDDTQIWDDAPD